VKFFRQTGRTTRKKGSGSPTKHPKIVDAVEEVMENEPKTSIRHLSQQMNLSV
jgi:hypothetical protein